MTVAVVGAGLIGTSVGLAVRRANPDAPVLLLDRGDSLDALATADLVVLATPVDAIIEVVQHASAVLRDRCVTDVGSTKRKIVEAARMAGLTRFVGGHPMAGAAVAGSGAARADLFDNRPWFLVPHGAEPDAQSLVRTFIAGLGARVVEFDDDGGEHDRLMAAVSHVPQVAASVLMKVVGDATGTDGFLCAGEGLRDATRLAASPTEIWESILSSNADLVRPLLRLMATELSGLADCLDDAASVRQRFAVAAAYRRALESLR